MTLTISSQSHVIFSFNNYMHFTQSQLHSEITRDAVAAGFKDHKRRSHSCIQRSQETQSLLHSEITIDVVAAAFRDHNRHTVNIGKF